jgi:hypothetical protein
MSIRSCGPAGPGENKLKPADRVLSRSAGLMPASTCPRLPGGLFRSGGLREEICLAYGHNPVDVRQEPWPCLEVLQLGGIHHGDELLVAAGLF